MFMSSGIRVSSPKKAKMPVTKQLDMVKTQLEDLRDYVELLEARVENKGKPRYSLDEAKQKLQL